MGHYNTLLALQGLGIMAEEELGRMQGPEEVDDCKGTFIMYNKGIYIYELTTVVITCTRLKFKTQAQVQAKQNPSVESGAGHEVPHIPEGLLVMDSGWERES